jgi:hypothetical protein
MDKINTQMHLLEVWENKKDVFIQLLKENKEYDAFGIAFFAGGAFTLERNAEQMKIISEGIIQIFSKVKRLLPSAEKEIDEILGRINKFTSM